MWISYFEPPKCFLMENKREFNNKGYRQMNEKLNIETCTTAMESPFSSSNVEYHHQ